jgi:PBSX family phage terminase large subunit
MMSQAVLEQILPKTNQQEIHWQLSNKQCDAIQLLDNSTIDELLYGGSKGGGKSILGCRWLYRVCYNLVTKFNLHSQKYPLPVAFMGRKQSKDFKDTTLETWKKFIDPSLYEIKEGDQEIIIKGAVKINYGGLDSQEAIKKFNSAEYAYIFIDQAEEINRDDYGMLKGTLRLKIRNQELPYKMLLTANPAECWLKQDFIYNNNLGRKRFLPALPSDNPFLASTYIDNLKEAFKHRPELLEAYLYGNWENLEEENAVIKTLWVRQAVNRELRFNPEDKITVADIGAGGDDTVIYNMQGYEIKKQDISGEKDTMKTAGKIIVHANDFRSDLIVIDKCGLGQGVYDRIKEVLGSSRNHIVYGLNSAEKPENETLETQFLNKRAEMWWYTSKLFSDCLTTLPLDELLIQELCAPKYEIIGSSGKIKIEAKEDIKLRLNRSTDKADAYVMGCYAQQFVQRRKDFKQAKHPTGRV